VAKHEVKILFSFTNRHECATKAKLHELNDFSGAHYSTMLRCNWNGSMDIHANFYSAGQI